MLIKYFNNIQSEYSIMDQKSHQPVDKESLTQIFNELSFNIPFKSSMRGKLLYQALHKPAKSMKLPQSTNLTFSIYNSYNLHYTTRDRSCRNIQNRMKLGGPFHPRIKPLDHSKIKAKLKDNLMHYKEGHY